MGFQLSEKGSFFLNKKTFGSVRIYFKKTGLYFGKMVPPAYSSKWLVKGVSPKPCITRLTLLRGLVIPWLLSTYPSHGSPSSSKYALVDANCPSERFQYQVSGLVMLGNPPNKIQVDFCVLLTSSILKSIFCCIFLRPTFLRSESCGSFSKFHKLPVLFANAKTMFA